MPTFTSRQLAEVLGRLGTRMNKGSLRNQPNPRRRQLFRAKKALLATKAFAFKYAVSRDRETEDADLGRGTEASAVRVDYQFAGR